MGFAGSVAAARAAIAAGALLLSSSTGCSRPPLSEQGGPDAAAEVLAPLFLAVTPCLDESDYVAGRKVVTFGFSADAGFGYDPKCLSIETGGVVTFSGSFAAHPLFPSEKRGTVEGNPIGGLSTGESETFTFSEAGFFAYYCGVHGAADDGSAMAGVVWAR